MNKPYYFRRKKSGEEAVHHLVCQYLRWKMASVKADGEFHTDQSGVHETNGKNLQDKLALNSKAGFPDIIVVCPWKGKGGLVLEVKESKKKLYTKTGEIRKTQHLNKQKRWIDLFNKANFYARFVGGYEEAKMTIDFYFDHPVYENSNL